MNKKLSIGMFALTMQSACAEITNPLSHMKATADDPTAKLMRWSADIDGDGRPEMFFANKEDYDAERANDSAQSWFAFFAVSEVGFVESRGIENAGESATSVGALAAIDLQRCFIGTVTEIGKKGVLTAETTTARAGQALTRVFFYAIEGEHWRRTKLAEFDPAQGDALFDKYLKDGKRTVVSPVEVTP